MNSCEKGRVINISYYYYFEYFTVEWVFIILLETELAVPVKTSWWKLYGILPGHPSHFCGSFYVRALVAHGISVCVSSKELGNEPTTLKLWWEWGEGPDYSVLTIRPRRSSSLSMVIGGLHDWPRHWPLTLTRSSLLTAFARLSTSTFFDADEFLWSLHIARVSKNGGHEETLSFSEVTRTHRPFRQTWSFAASHLPHPHLRTRTRADIHTQMIKRIVLFICFRIIRYLSTKQLKLKSLFKGSVILRKHHKELFSQLAED